MKRMRNASRLAEKAVIVTGTPGTGKTAFSKRLAAEISADYISLTDYVSRRGLYGTIDWDRGSKVIDVNRTRTHLVGRLSRSGKLAVVDTHVPDDILPKRLVKQVFVLRCHPRVLETRLRRKHWKTNKISENLVAEILDACLIAAIRYYGGKKIMQLDTSQKTVRQCVSSAKRILQGKPTRQVEVDWLARLDREGTLERYLV